MLTNQVNGKRYIGKAKSLAERMGQHFKAAKRGRFVLYSAMRMHSVDVFTGEVLCSFATEQDALEAEVRLIRTLGTKVPAGYNMTDGGEGTSGHSHGSEARRKISDAHKGRKHSADARANMSRAHLGHRQTEETRAKKSAALTGITRSPETRAKMSAAAKGRTGRKASEATRAKMSASHRARRARSSIST